MSHDNHAVQVEWAMAVRRKPKINYSAHNQGDFRYLSIVHNSDHDSDDDRVDRIFVDFSWAILPQSDGAFKQWWPTARQKGSELHHQGEFLHIIYLSQCMTDIRKKFPFHFCATMVLRTMWAAPFCTTQSFHTMVADSTTIAVPSMWLNLSTFISDNK